MKYKTNHRTGRHIRAIRAIRAASSAPFISNARLFTNRLPRASKLPTRHRFIMYVSATYPTAVMVPAPSTAPHMYS